MTVLIAVKFPGGAMLAADSRTTLPFAENGILTDDAQKVHVIHGQAVAAFGVNVISDHARKLLEGMTMPQSGDEFLTFVGHSLSVAWIKLKPAFAADVVLDAPAMRAGFLGAGLDAKGTYVGGCMSTIKGADTPLLVRDDWQRIVLGAETFGSTQHLDDQVAPLIASAIRAGLAPIEVGRQAAEAAAVTIRAMSKLDKSVGGAIRFRIQLNTGESTQGTLPP